jgi:hypothetical protein
MNTDKPEALETQNVWPVTVARMHNTAETSENDNIDEYQAPQVTAHGSLRDLTQGILGGEGDLIAATNGVVGGSLL